MGEQNETDEGAHIEVGTNTESPVEVDEVEVEKASQPDRLTISSFPFAPEFMAPDKKRAIKILEEASEACEAFKDYLKGAPYSPEDQLEAQAEFLEEFCDTFQAIFTAAACVGVQQGQLDDAMQECFEKNIDKGRYPDYDFGEYHWQDEGSDDQPNDILHPSEPPASAATYGKPSISEIMQQAGLV